MSSIHTISELEEWCRRFPDLTIEKRGEEVAQFIYARGIDRAFELSLDPPCYFIEGWKCSDPESEDAPEFTEKVGSTEDLENLIRNWMAT